MHPIPRWQKRKTARVAAVGLAALAPLPAFAAGIGSTAWGAYLFFAIVATIVIVLLLHEALDEEGVEADEDRTGSALGIPRYTNARRDRSPSPDGTRRPRG